MTYYRAMTNLDAGHNNRIRIGDVFNEGRLSSKAIKILSEMGKISSISFPPLEVIPGWKIRSSKLKEISTEQFLEMPNDELAIKMKTKPNMIESWKAEILRWMATPEKTG